MTLARMKLVAFLFTAIQLIAAIAAVVPSCNKRHEFCIDIKQCPAYEKYADRWSPNGPGNVTTRIKHCNTEHVGNETIHSVCCPSPMNHKYCGIRGDNRIYGGEEATAFSFPWMALLQNRNGSWVCGGTLVSSRYVLTAAHCVLENQLHDQIVTVRLGENDLKQPIDCKTLEELKMCAPPPQDIPVDKIIPHPEYDMLNRIHDIALLRLARPALTEKDSNFSVRTICLPDGTPKQRQLTPWTYIVSGWGLTENGTSSDVLRYAQIPAVPLDNCAPWVHRFLPQVTLDERHICAGGVEGVDACRGDSGGPLHYVRNDTSRYVQQGIVAYGLGDCGTHEPGVYTNISHYISWLVQHVDE